MFNFQNWQCKPLSPPGRPSLPDKPGREGGESHVVLTFLPPFPLREVSQRRTTRKLVLFIHRIDNTSRKANIGWVSLHSTQPGRHSFRQLSIQRQIGEPLCLVIPKR